MRTYMSETSAVFWTTSGRYGGLSNFAPHYRIPVNGLLFLTSEALYQACRFPDDPGLQKAISLDKVTRRAKELAQTFAERTRPDWHDVNLEIMWWVLRAKLAANYKRFGDVLRSTQMFSIVEHSTRDTFWGAAPTGNMYKGENHLGRMLERLRDELVGDTTGYLRRVDPLNIPNFKIDGRPVESIKCSQE